MIYSLNCIKAAVNSIFFPDMIIFLCNWSVIRLIKFFCQIKSKLGIDAEHFRALDEIIL